MAMNKMKVLFFNSALAVFVVGMPAFLAAAETRMAPYRRPVDVLAQAVGSVLGDSDELYRRYCGIVAQINLARHQDLGEELNRVLKPLTKVGTCCTDKEVWSIDALIKHAGHDTRLSTVLHREVVGFLSEMKAIVAGSVSRGFAGVKAKCKAAWVGLAAGASGFLPSIFPDASFKARKGWWAGKHPVGLHGAPVMPYALDRELSAEACAAADVRECQPLVIHNKRNGNIRMLRRAECMKDLFLQHAVKRNTQLRPFVVTPNWDGDLFESTAHAIAQIDCLSVEEFKRRRDEAEPYVRKRLELQYVVPNEPTVTEYPEELLRLTEDYYEEVERALRAVGSAADRVKKIGEGPARMNVDNVLVFRFSPRCNGTIILKVPNPYAYYKLQNIYRDFEDDYGGENHSVYRNVERVLIAADIRRDRSTKVTAPDKRLALRKGVTPGRLITDKTAIVMAEFITEGPGGLYDLSYPDINRIIDVGDKYGLADLHKWNVICGSGGHYYLIDTEITQARRYGLKPEAQYVGLLNELTFTGASKYVAEVLARRKKASGAR